MVIGVSLDWLLNDEESNTNQYSQQDRDDYACIPLFGMAASAGYGEQVKMRQISKKLPFRRDWLGLRKLGPEQLSCIHVKGSSMESTIPNGATILVDKRPNHALDGGIFVLTIDNRIFAKRTRRQPATHQRQPPL